MQDSVTLRLPVALALAASFTCLGTLLAISLQRGGRCSARPLLSPGRARWPALTRVSADPTPQPHQGNAEACRCPPEDVPKHQDANIGSSGGWSSAPRVEIGADAAGTNDLWDFFQRHKKGPIVHKWHPYFDIYSRYGQRFRGSKLKFLEIGVQSGGSIRMWQDYFGAEQLTYVGVDMDGYTRELFADPPRVNVLIGDQGSQAFWKRVADEHADGFDIILDDGGHSMKQQITTFESTWDLLKPGGVYICEDTATSMDFAMPPSNLRGSAWGGGYGRNDTWHEYAKRLADVVQGHYIDRKLHPDFDTHNRTDTLLSVAFYDQMVVLEKGAHPPAGLSKTGTFQIPYGPGPVNETKLAEYKAQLAMSLKP